MFKALGRFDEANPFVTAVRDYQEARGLAVDGDVGKQTRTALIGDYMGIDGTSLPPDAQLTAHGCGEHFPEVPTDDGVSEPANRRVELFFFRDGIDPPPPAETSDADATAYPQWRDGSAKTMDLTAEETELHRGAVFLQLFDAMGDAPLAGVDYKIEHSAGTLNGTTDADGKLRHHGLFEDDFVVQLEGMEDCHAIRLALDDENPQVRYLRSA